MARIFQTASLGEAHLRVALVNQPGEADLWVNIVSSWGWAAGEALWFICPSKQEANAWVYFGSIGMAQLKLAWVAHPGQAGWQVDHPLKGRLFRQY